MSSDVKKILEIQDDVKPQGGSQQPLKIKSATYKKLVAHPFLKQSGKFQQFVSPFNKEIVCTPYPPYSNLAANELYKQLQSANNVIGQIYAIKISEFRYYKYLLQNSNCHMIAYQSFLQIVSTVLKFQLQFVKAADFLQMNLFDVLLIFHTYSKMVLHFVNSFTIIQNQAKFMRCYQLCNYFVNTMQGEAKILEQREKHFQDVSFVQSEIFQVSLNNDFQYKENNSNQVSMQKEQKLTRYQQLIQQQLIQKPCNVQQNIKNSKSQSNFEILQRNQFYPYLVDYERFQKEQLLIKVVNQDEQKQILDIVQQLNVQILDCEYDLEDDMLNNVFDISFLQDQIQLNDEGGEIELKSKKKGKK